MAYNPTIMRALDMRPRTGVYAMVIFSLIIAALARFLSPVLGITTPQSFPPALTQSEERECFEKMKTGDEDSRQKLILHNLRLVSHIVRKYYSTSKNQEDLVSVGTIGLVKAVDTYNIDNGTRFATYAAKCIQNAILSKRTFLEHTMQKGFQMTKNGACSTT